MVDILLIQPPIRDFYLTAKRTIPYGLASIASALIRNGFTVNIFDGLATSKSRIIEIPSELGYLKRYYRRSDQSSFALFNEFRHYGYSYDHIGQKARESGAFLVGIASLFTPYVNEAIETAERVKAYHPECKVVIGGHHATVLPQSIMQSPEVDFVLRGEGEVGMPLLAAAVKSGLPPDEVPGIVNRKPDGSLNITLPAQLPATERYPIPALHLIKHKYYRRNQRGSTVIVASRGCPMRCSYCSVGESSHLAYRRRSVNSVMREIEAAVNRHAVGFIDFEDENLSLDREWFLKLLMEIKATFGANRLELRAMNGLFPPSLDEQIISAMQVAGFKTLNLALGTTDGEQLKRFQRPDVTKAFDRALHNVDKYDLTAVGYIIVGAPFQNPETSVADLLYLARRRVLVGVSVFYPSPGSNDYDICKKLGLLPLDFICMRSAALPLSHTTKRTEAITLLRLGRLLNFLKYQIDAASTAL
ncbi:MAG: radical SAM protein, partial [Desulfobacterales bacterium]